MQRTNSYLDIVDEHKYYYQPISVNGLERPKLIQFM